jgi:hypothetical protein
MISQIERVIADFDRAINDLNRAIETEQIRTRIDDPNHFAYSTAAQAMIRRRSNLARSIDRLKRQLADASANARPVSVASGTASHPPNRDRRSRYQSVANLQHTGRKIRMPILSSSQRGMDLSEITFLRHSTRTKASNGKLPLQIPADWQPAGVCIWRPPFIFTGTVVARKALR